MSTKDGKSKLFRLDNSSSSTEPKGKMISVHFKQNHGTSSGSLCSSLYSEFEISLHFFFYSLKVIQQILHSTIRI